MNIVSVCKTGFSLSTRSFKVMCFFFIVAMYNRNVN